MGNIVNMLRQQAYSSYPYLRPPDYYPFKVDDDGDVERFTKRRKELIKKVGFDEKEILVAKVSQIEDVNTVRLTIRVGSYSSYIPWEQFRCEIFNEASIFICIVYTLFDDVVPCHIGNFASSIRIIR
jgi:hypothetical protein